MFLHEYAFETIAKVALPDGCTNPWIVLKIWHRRDSGTEDAMPSERSVAQYGAVDSSRTELPQSVVKKLAPREPDVAVRPRSARSMSASVCTIVFTMAGASASSYWRESVSATTFSRPGTWATSVANSLIKASWCRFQFETGSLGLEKCTRQRFLILINAETSSLKDVSEFEDRAVYRQQLQVICRIARFGGGCPTDWKTPEAADSRWRFDELLRQSPSCSCLCLHEAWHQAPGGTRAPRQPAVSLLRWMLTSFHLTRWVV